MATTIFTALVALAALDFILVSGGGDGNTYDEIYEHCNSLPIM